MMRQNEYLWSKGVNCVPNNTILNMTNLKAFPDAKICATQMSRFLFDWVENIMRKGENAGHQHFLLFPQCSQKVSTPGPERH